MIKIYLVGIGCVGKSSIGKLLAEELGFSFYDFDTEIEKYFGKPIEYIQEKHIFSYDFREETKIDFAAKRKSNNRVHNPLQ